MHSNTVELDGLNYVVMALVGKLYIYVHNLVVVLNIYVILYNHGPLCRNPSV